MLPERNYFGGPVRFVLAGSGHIAGVVNPPAAQISILDRPEAVNAHLDGWLEAATEHPGSWWPDWLEWLKQHDNKLVPARKVGSKMYKPIEDAPGSYVKMKS